MQCSITTASQGPAADCTPSEWKAIMWPYTQDEVTWLALPLEREVAQRTERAIEQHWMKEVGVPQQPANDDSGREMRTAGR